MKIIIQICIIAAFLCSCNGKKIIYQYRNVSISKSDLNSNYLEPNFDSIVKKTSWILVFYTENKNLRNIALFDSLGPIIKFENDTVLSIYFDDSLLKYKVGYITSPHKIFDSDTMYSERYQDTTYFPGIRDITYFIQEERYNQVSFPERSRAKPKYIRTLYCITLKVVRKDYLFIRLEEPYPTNSRKPKHYYLLLIRKGIV